MAADEYEYVFKDFQNFYLFLKKIFEDNLFFNEPSRNLINFFKKNLTTSKEIRVVTSDESEASLEYKKIIAVRYDKRLGEIRVTVVFNDVSETLDLKKSYQALRPNLLHSVDATFVRLVITRLPRAIITIHDSFGIDILNIDCLITTANHVINLLDLR